MVKITIETTAVPPIPLKAFIDNLENNAFDIHFNPSIGFEHKFNLPEGKYIFSVSGMNGLDQKNKKGTTTVLLNGTFKKGPIPNSPQKSSGSFFIIGYEFEI
jgi:hypothetical protein